MAWHAKEVVRSIYEITDDELASEFVEQLGQDFQDHTCPPEVRSLGRTIVRWRVQIVSWHQALVSNGPTEAVNNLIKRIKRIGFGFRRFVHTAPACCPTPASRTGHYSPRSLPAESDEPDQWGLVKGDRHAGRAGRSQHRTGRDAE
jgi:hypothetical protein